MLSNGEKQVLLSDFYIECFKLAIIPSLDPNEITKRFLDIVKATKIITDRPKAIYETAEGIRDKESKLSN